MNPGVAHDELLLSHGTATGLARVNRTRPAGAGVGDVLCAAGARRPEAINSGPWAPPLRRGLELRVQSRAAQGCLRIAVTV